MVRPSYLRNIASMRRVTAKPPNMLTAVSASASTARPRIDLLAGYGLRGERMAGAPGVYVGGAKIAALGLRVKNGCCYHGVALNVDMELEPFSAINPCGYPGLKVTQLRDLGVAVGWEAAGEALLEQLKRQIEK